MRCTYNIPPMSTGTLIIVSAPSGAGKTSLVKALCDELDNIKPSISHTTRARRSGENDGIDYHFIDEAEFKDKREADAFLESARVFDHYYGTSREGVDQILNSGTDVVLEIDWQGARQINKKLDTAVSIFIMPPSLAALEERLRKRGQDDEAIITRRMKAATLEMVHYDEFDYLIFNDDFEVALSELSAIVLAQRCKTGKQQANNRPLIKSLLA